jgi:hypothetical protein
VPALALRFSRGGAKYSQKREKVRGRGRDGLMVFLVVVGAVFLFEFVWWEKSLASQGMGRTGWANVRRGKGGVVCVLLLDWAFLG